MLATEQRLLARADASEAWALLERICAFQREQPADVDKAVEMVADALRAGGIPATTAVMDLYLSLPGKGRVTTDGREFLAKPSAMSVPAPSGISAEIVYVPGHKDMIASLLDSSQDTYELQSQIAGRIVITEGIAGPGIVSSFAPFKPKAIIAINPGDGIHSAICTPIWGNPGLDDLPKKPLLSVVSVNRPDGEALKKLSGTREVVTVFSDLEENWYPSKYLCLDIPSPIDPERFVLLHGHIDSWDVGVGDNGTGDVTMFAVAKMLWAHRSELRRSVRIAWWPGHSTGRYAGSTWYADQFAIDLAENCVAQINCDSPGCRWATEYLDVFCMSEAAPFLLEAIADATGKQGQTMRPFRAGDWSFNNIGVTGLLALSSTMPPDLVKEKGYYRVGGNGGNIEWHTDRDQMDIADKDVMQTDIGLYALVTYRLAASTILPFDFRAVVKDYEDTLDAIREASPQLELSPLFDSCAELKRALKEFYSAIEKGTIETQAANNAILALERWLVSINFATRSRFEQDPALDTPPLPAIASQTRLRGLTTEQAKFAHVQFVRGRNKIVYGMRQAIQISRAAIGAVT